MTHRAPHDRDAPRLHPPKQVREIAERLEAAGFETWCVGGAVRDALLGLPHLDWDLATVATPEQVRRLFRRSVPVGEEFGTIGVLDADGVLHEVTTFRRDVRTDGRHAVVEFGASLDEDLARRDFTINAMAWSNSAARLHDPFGGRADLRRGVVRAVGDPRTRMREDRLRALRALRFAGRFGFAIDDATWSAVVESADSLPRLSRERVQQELLKTLEQVSRPSTSLALWRRSGALRALLPALDAEREWRLCAADGLASPEATRDPGRARRRLHLRVATILSGMPKAVVTRLLRELRLANRDVDRLAHLAAVGGTLADALDAPPADAAPSDRVLRQWAARAGRTDLADVLRVAMSAAIARKMPAAGQQAGTGVSSPPNDSTTGSALSRRAPVLGGLPAWRSLYRRAVRVAYRDPVAIADLAVDGEDLMQAGVPPGPAIGKALQSLRDWVLDDPARNARDVLLAHVRDQGRDA